MQAELTTLCYIEKEDSYLMLHRVKKENDINHDKWIGVGGHFEEMETPDECLLREVYEETGLTLTEYRFRGIVTFITTSGICEYMFLYTATGYTGDFLECSEGDLEWVKKSDLLGINLWTGDEIFLKLLKEDRPAFSLKLCYDENRLTEAVLDGKKLELFDILDENGNTTGLVRERSIAHSIGTLHRTVHVWIIREKEQGFEVLLQQRAFDKDSFPGCYDISCAGHVQAGDDYLDSAVRELNEELGIQADKDELEFVCMHKGICDTEFYGKPFLNHELSAMYIYRKPIDEASIVLQKEEIEAVLFMDYEEATQKIHNQELRNCIFMDEWEMLGQYKKILENKDQTI